MKPIHQQIHEKLNTPRAPLGPYGPEVLVDVSVKMDESRRTDIVRLIISDIMDCLDNEIKKPQ